MFSILFLCAAVLAMGFSLMTYNESFSLVGNNTARPSPGLQNSLTIVFKADHPNPSDKDMAIATAEGTALFEEATRTNLGRPIFIYLDDLLITAPVVNSVITVSNAVITGGGPGGFSLEESRALANDINMGALPFDLLLIAIESES